MSRTPETVVEVGVEGGSLTLTRVRSRAGGSQFFLTEDEGTLLDFLSEEDRGKFGDGLSRLGPVATWEEALVLLDRHRWTVFHPLVVHEDFRAAVWTAVVERKKAREQDAEDWLKISMPRWRSLCFPQEENHGGWGKGGGTMRRKTFAGGGTSGPSPFITLPYPKEWATEYKRTGFVGRWRRDYRTMFEDHKGTTGADRGKLVLFPQYALMYLLRKQDGIHSITWYKIATVSPKSVNRERILRCWATMKKWMGEKDFIHLQEHLVKRRFRTISGEPDLFCWNPKSGRWFFAEAKGKDPITKSQKRWYDACHQVLPEAEIRRYRLIPTE